MNNTNDSSNVFKFDPDSIVTSANSTFTIGNSNTATSGTLTTNSNYSGIITTGPAYFPYNYYPYSYYGYIQSSPVKYDIQLRKVENGWILYKEGKEYILKSPDEVVKYMKEDKSK